MWREIQGAVSIDLDEKKVDFEGRQLRIDPKLLCESLVDYSLDGRIQFAHQTVRM